MAMTTEEEKNKVEYITKELNKIQLFYPERRRKEQRNKKYI
jgi:hypothetical protein